MTLKSEPITFSWLVNMVLLPLCGVLLWTVHQSVSSMQQDHVKMKVDVAVMQAQSEVNARTMMQMSSDIRDIRNQFTRQQPPK